MNHFFNLETDEKLIMLFGGILTITCLSIVVSFLSGIRPESVNRLYEFLEEFRYIYRLLYNQTEETCLPKQEVAKLITNRLLVKAEKQICFLIQSKSIPKRYLGPQGDEVEQLLRQTQLLLCEFNMKYVKDKEPYENILFEFQGRLEKLIIERI